MDKPTWKFNESQRDSVCLGKLCPACLGTNIKYMRCVPGLYESNMAFDCADCGEQWEGY